MGQLEFYQEPQTKLMLVFVPEKRDSIEVN